MKKENKKKNNSVFFYFFVLLLLSILIYQIYLFIFLLPTNNLDKKFEIKKGDNLKTISNNLEKDGFVKSNWLFYSLAKIYGLDKIIAGKYDFSNLKTNFEILDKIKNTDYKQEYQKFTIFEGEPNYLIAKRLAEKMKNIDEKKFLEKAKKYEGMLYPDTYNLDFDFNEDQAIKFFVDNFYKKLKKNNLTISENDFQKILKIASLIEAEAGRAKYEDKRKVASVIYNRLKKDMLLQLDYIFFYIQKVDRNSLTPKEIERIIWKGKKIDSPYNNYKYLGLPPTAISNPSIDSIKAALNPANTDYLYYITGDDGNFYYSKTNTGHLKNVKNYIN